MGHLATSPQTTRQKRVDELHQTREMLLIVFFASEATEKICCSSMLTEVVDEVYRAMTASTQHVDHVTFLGLPCTDKV